ncbi:arginyl-tRNA synthetase [Caloranaerobacter azorensis DSM 13643]|uniref:Arginine--tRNA ligase n=1 Tax=Caloranaerobacter azorensis DSM 13643 TaxID=1121264 RepID=A0A1M5UUM3_9FIRM|nr:arginine--tRNA ligase [Caloranaerobacter azorensis]SHH66649.1 arginyl-tRNA synthetase [Caloranaerobacter azorensis DSM 13643]
MIDFKKEIARIVSEKVESLNQEDVEALIEIPPNYDMGDYAMPCFKLAKTFRKAPNLIAQEIAESLDGKEYFEKIENVGPYVNFFIDRKVLARTVLEEIFSKKENYGSSNMGNGKNIVIDFSSPNIAKPFHVGHLRSTVIGNSLYKIYEFLGYNCIGINHLGDWGTQFGKLITAYKKWGNKEEIEKEPIKTLLKLYVKFHDEAELNPELEEEGRRWFKKLEDGDEEARKLWNWFVDLSLKEFNKIYDLLKVKFDYFTGESFYNDKMDRIIELLKEKNLLKESKGAYVVDLEEFNMPPCLVLKSDGATLYPTRDITAAIYRKETFNFEKALYVTDYSQSLHFAQWFKVIELMGFEWADKLEHVPFGRVSTEEGRMQTRKGNVILLEELLNKAIDKVREIIEEKNPNLENKDEVARQVGIGAVIFNDLSNNKIKDIVFNWDRMLSFDGETGPYVQYTHARANSVLNKRKYDITNDVDYSILTNQEAVDVIRLLQLFPEAIVNAMEKNEPSIITRHIVDIAQAFNKFYHECPIIVEDENIQKARLLLVFAVKTVLKTGLGLLGIDAPDKM